jgi:hypothetical protein
LGWCRIPTAICGGAELSHAVLFPSEAAVDTIRHGEYDWRVNITDAYTLQGLSPLPDLQGRVRPVGSRDRSVPVNSKRGFVVNETDGRPLI